MAQEDVQAAVLHAVSAAQPLGAFLRHQLRQAAASVRLQLHRPLRVPDALLAAYRSFL